jgi:hypothetical protein
MLMVRVSDNRLEAVRCMMKNLTDSRDLRKGACLAVVVKVEPQGQP